MTKRYLGDSVYYEKNDFGITLTTENGMGPSNTVHLEPEVISLLLKELGMDFDKKLLSRILKEEP